MKSAVMPATDSMEYKRTSVPHLSVVKSEEARQLRPFEVETRADERFDAEDPDDMWDNMPV